ncbi:MAG: ROK family protein [Sphaerochaetaceae bacterium]
MNSDPLRAIDIKQHNQNIILSYIHSARNRGGISQSELVGLTGLKAPSVFRIFNALEEQELIRPCEGAPTQAAEAKKGRRPSYYTICPDARYTIGVEFWAACISLGVFNFNGDRIHSTQINLSDWLSAEQIVDKIVLLIRSAIEVLGLDRSRIIGIGIAAPGKVDVKEGRIVFYHRISGMTNLPLKQELEKRLQLPVLVHNNCSAIAYYDYKYNAHEDNDSLFTFLFRSGVNGSMVSAGKIYVTSNGTTLEAGHLPISFDGPQCSCGLNGCLQAYMFELNKQFSQESDSLSLFQSLEKPLENGDPKAIQIMEKASFYLYTAMKSVIRMLGPDSFLITSPNLGVANALRDGVIKLFENESDIFQASKPAVLARQYDTMMAQRGASDLVLDRFFS